MSKFAFILILTIGLSAFSTEGYGQSGFAQNGDLQFQIDLYPNPAIDYIIVEIPRSSVGNVQFELRSMIGNKIEIDPEEIDPTHFRISLKNYASGYYFLIVKDDYQRQKKAYKFLKS